MDVRSARLLAEAFLAWKHRQRVGLTHIARHGPVSRTTIEYVRKAIPHDIKRDTLRRLANGLAAELRPPHPQDTTVGDQIYRDLHRAAGYGDVPGDLPETLLETALYYRLGTMEQAHAWEAVIDRLARLSPDEIDRLGRAGEVTE